MCLEPVLCNKISHCNEKPVYPNEKVAPNLHNHFHLDTTWRRKWQPTPVLLPGKSHGRRSLVGCSPWGLEESDTTERLHFHVLEKEMATHSSVLAWRIPGTAEPGGLQSMGSHRAGHDWSDLAAAAAGLRETMGCSPPGAPPMAACLLDRSSALLCCVVWLSGVHAWVHPHVCTGANRPNRVSNEECYLSKFVIYGTCFKVLVSLNISLSSGKEFNQFSLAKIVTSFTGNISWFFWLWLKFRKPGIIQI